MVALNANTGKVDPGFGREGEVPLEVAYSGAPTIYKNVLLIGSNFYGPGGSATSIRRWIRRVVRLPIHVHSMRGRGSCSGNFTTSRDQARKATIPG